MTLAEVFEQAQTLNPDERRELAKLLIDSLAVTTNSPATEEHWGQSLNRLLDELDPIELKYPEIEDPVDWVHQLRADRQNKSS